MFVRISEHLTSKLCPRRTCRDADPDFRQHMKHPTVTDSKPVKRVIRQYTCTRCATNFHRDLSAAQNIRYALLHCLQYGWHPFKFYKPAS